MVRFRDKKQILNSEISDKDIMPITDSEDNDNDKKISIGQLKEYFENNISAFAGKDLSNTDMLVDAILEAPNGVIETNNDKNAILIKQGVKVLFAQGRKSNGKLNNIEYIVKTDISQATTNIANGIYVLFINSNGNAVYVPISQVFAARTQPTVTATVAYWYDIETNYWKITKDTGATWSNIIINNLGQFTIANGLVTEIVANTVIYIPSPEAIMVRDLSNITPSGKQDIKDLIQPEIDETKAELQANINAKQDKLVAGDGITITNNVISADAVSSGWGNITGDVRAQEDLQQELAIQNMYTTGAVSTDAQGYEQLLEMKNSGEVQTDTVIINNEAVEIPYTLSKTGSKIVDVAYRDKIQELYTQDGYAPYYTIDETNQNFTLPMGEIYGMIASKVDKTNDNQNGGVEVGTILCMPFGVDESENKYRYLNGQAIIAEDYPEFTKKIKKWKQERPNLFCTAAEQLEIINSSKLGQCGKFAIDYETKEVTTTWAVFSQLNDNFEEVYRVVYKPASEVKVGDVAYDWDGSGNTLSDTPYTITNHWNGTTSDYIIGFNNAESNGWGHKADGSLDYTNSETVETDEIRQIGLPKVINITGLTDLSNCGLIKDESLPNITGSVRVWNANGSTGAFNGVNDAIYGRAGGNVRDTGVVTFNASLSSSAYQDNAPVQQEAIQYPYVICVNSGVEETERPINDYTVNNPYSYGDSKYYGGELDNLSWLKSTGSFERGKTYNGFYDWVLTNVNKGVEGFIGQIIYAWGDANGVTYTTTPNVKVGSVCYNMAYQKSGYIEAINSNGTVKIRDDINNASYDNISYYASGNISSTPIITDYDFVINTTDETFRLPLKNGQEGVFASGVKGNGFGIHLTNGSQQGDLVGLGGSTNIAYNTDGVNASIGTSYTTDTRSLFDNLKTIGVTTDPTKSGMVVDTTVPAGYNLYYYVGNTLQNVDLINIARMKEELTDKVSKRDCKAYVVETYQNGSSWYRVYSDGWCEQGGYVSIGSGASTVTFLKSYIDTNYNCQVTNFQIGTDGNPQYWTRAVIVKNTTSFTTNQYSNFFVAYDWQTSGYIR